jgi:hypothetical protein
VLGKSSKLGQQPKFSQFFPIEKIEKNWPNFGKNLIYSKFSGPIFSKIWLG